MTDGPRTCANCGNIQVSGDFCEKCGTRLPPVATQVPGAGEPSPPPAGTIPPRYVYATDKGFFGRLFDFSFQQFITPSIIKVLFIVSLVVICIGVLAYIVYGFWYSVGLGFFFLIGGLIGGFLALLYVRVLLEIFIVFFRIYDNTDNIAKGKR